MFGNNRGLNLMDYRVLKTPSTETPKLRGLCIPHSHVAPSPNFSSPSTHQTVAHRFASFNHPLLPITTTLGFMGRPATVPNLVIMWKEYVLCADGRVEEDVGCRPLESMGFTSSIFCIDLPLLLFSGFCIKWIWEE